MAPGEPPAGEDSPAPPRAEVREEVLTEQTASFKVKANMRGPPPQMFSETRVRNTLYPKAETAAIYWLVSYWRAEACQWYGLPLTGSVLNKQETKWIRNKVKDFYTEAPGVLGRLESYKAYGRDAELRSRRSSCRAVVCQAYGQIHFYNLHLAFGNLNDELVDMLDEEHLLRLRRNTGNPNAVFDTQPNPDRLSDRNKAIHFGQPDVPEPKGIQHKTSPNKELRKRAKDLAYYKKKSEETFWWESWQIRQGKMTDEKRTVTKDELDTRTRDAEETRSRWLRLSDSNDRWMIPPLASPRGNCPIRISNISQHIEGFLV